MSLEDRAPPAAAPGARLYLRPLPTTDGDGLPIAGGPLRFREVELAVRSGNRVDRTVAAIDPAFDWALRRGYGGAAKTALDRITAPRAPLAGLTLDRPRIMGIVNVTPDSFSDGGAFLDPRAAIDHGLALLAEGADILDVGGESTRPGAEPVPEDEELRRTLPVVRGLVEAGAIVSIDTRHAAVMRAAVSAGAALINDVTALAGDPSSPATAAESAVPIVLMHMQGRPQTMQTDPRYDDVVLDILDALENRIVACEAAGIPRSRISVDPGIGFGKTVAHNATLLGRLSAFHALGCPILLGASRKSFIGRLDREAPADQRLAGSLAAALTAVNQGAQIIRVHDIAATRQAIAVLNAFRGQFT